MIRCDQYRDSAQKFKTCTKCHNEQPIEKFSPNRLSKGGRHTVCNRCRSRAAKERYQRNPEAHKAIVARYRERRGPVPRPFYDRCASLQKKYGITLAQYEEMLSAQGGSCKLCRSSEPGGRYDIFVVDHCHDSGAVRGLLCHACNVSLGRLGDNESGLLIALAYVVANGGDMGTIAQRIREALE